MNKRQKEVIQSQLNDEKEVLKRLEKQYAAALNDINTKIRILQSDELTQSRIYRIEHQKALKSQVSGILEKLHSDEYSTIEQFLKDSYTSGFIGTTYDLFGQGVPLIMPIDPKDAVRAVMTDSKISGGLYNSLGVDVKKLKKSISAEISRGLASDMSYEDITRNIANATKAPLGRARTIVLTETHRIKQASTRDVQVKAKEKGADVLKQWNSTLDGETRKTHRRLDGQIREVEEPFEMDGKEAMYPGDFNDPAEDCNCRCESLTRARWALGEDELATLKERAEFFGLDKTKDFEDFKGKYLKAAVEVVKEEAALETINQKATDALLEAMDARREYFGMTTLPSSEFRNTKLGAEFSANYTGISIESATAFNDTITKLSKDYYTGFASIKVGDPKEFFGTSIFASTTHQNIVGKKTLTLNPIKTNDFNKMVERIEDLSKTGYAVKLSDGKAGEYIATHEFAHSLIDMKGSLKNYVGLDEKLMKRIRKEVEKVFDEYLAEIAELEIVIADKKKNPAFTDLSISAEEQMKAFKELQDAQNDLKKVKISKYSMENSDEFLAEAFTQAKIGEDRSPYTDKLMKIIDKYFKRK